MAVHEPEEKQGLLHDKLKDQIAVSIKDSLTKATTVLSSLHRVHSYMDVLQTMPSFQSGGGGGGGGEGIKNALEQVRAIRNDAAALLQTIYLTELGLQSLRDVERTPTRTSSDVTIVPMLGDSINNSNLTGSAAINSNNDVVKGRAVVELTQRPEMADTVLPPPLEPMTKEATPIKKQAVGVLITKCSSCRRKFATNHPDPLQDGKCKSCRSTGTPLTPAPAAVMSSTSGGLHPILTSTPQRSTSGPKAKIRKISNTPISCKVCGTSFVYRRCLFRHLRENHPTIDLNNIHEYIDTGREGDEVLGDEPTPPVEPGSQNTSMNVTVGSEIPIPPDMNNSNDQQSSLVQSSGMEVQEGSTPQFGNIEAAIKQVYSCTICNKVFDRPYRLTRHLNIHDPNRPRVSCQICDRSFTRLDTLENHMKSMHSEERPYTCPYTTCQKSFAMQTALTNHLKVHTNGKPYKCLECDSSFSLLLEYKAHMRQEHADTESLRCTDCYRVFPDAESLETHRSVEHLLECEICGKTFARLAYLQLHVQVHSGKSVYNCKICSEGFDLEYAYKQHMRTHPKNKKRFHCQVCDKSFEAPSNLIAHYRCEEHREKAIALGLGTSTTILNTIEGDLSDMNALVDEVAMGTNAVSMETTHVGISTDAMGTNAVSMETTPVAISTDAMATKQISMQTNPVVLEMEEDDAAKMISSIAQGGSYNET